MSCEAIIGTPLIHSLFLRDAFASESSGLVGPRFATGMEHKPLAVADSDVR